MGSSCARDRRAGLRVFHFRLQEVETLRSHLRPERAAQPQVLRGHRRFVAASAFSFREEGGGEIAASAEPEGYESAESLDVARFRKDGDARNQCKRPCDQKYVPHFHLSFDQAPALRLGNSRTFEAPAQGLNGVEALLSPD